jgi:hypothetical protein
VKEERTKKARNKKIWKKKILQKFHSIGSSFFLPFELDRRARERDSVFSMNWCFVVGTETEEEQETERQEKREKKKQTGAESSSGYVGYDAK